MASHKKITHWQSVFKSQRDSGLTTRKFCQQHKINISTYYAWRKRLAEIEQVDTTKQQHLVPLFVSGSVTTHASPLMITTPSGYQLAFDEDIAIEKLHQIMALIA